MTSSQTVSLGAHRIALGVTILNLVFSGILMMVGHQAILSFIVLILAWHSQRRWLCGKTRLPRWIATLSTCSVSINLIWLASAYWVLLFALIYLSSYLLIKTAAEQSVHRPASHA